MNVTNAIHIHPEYIRKLRQAGGKAVKEQTSIAGVEPSVDAGLFDYDEFEFGKEYKQFDLFTYNGKPGFVRSPHTSAEQWIPFSTGTESLYGARPRQRPDGTYPYVYNMRAEKDMRVQSEKDGSIYICIQPADPLLYDPADVPALFTKE